MPNFWGCRCCQSKWIRIRIRAINPDGNQLWVWNKFPIQYESIRPLSFSVSSSGCLFCELEGETTCRISQTTLLGVTEWTNDINDDFPLLTGISCTLPVHDVYGNVYVFVSGVDSSAHRRGYLASFDSSGVFRWTYEPAETNIFNIASYGDTIWFTTGVFGEGKIYGVHSDGTLNGTRSIGISVDRFIAGGEIRTNADGDLFYAERNAAGDVSLIVIDENCSVVSSSSLTPTDFTGGSSASLGLLSDGSMAGLGVNSSGDSVLHNLETDANVCVFDPSGSLRSSDLDDAGIIYTNETVSTYNRVIKYDQSGAKLWTLTETTSSSDSSLNLAPQVACHGDLILIGTATQRLRLGFTVV